MGQLDRQAIRRKILGTLLRHVRLSAGRSQAELAAALHVSKYRYGQYERGEGDLSLPELEHIAQLCGVPLGYFFDDEAAVEDESIDIIHEDKPRIQRKIVGALLRHARTLTGKTQQECASLLGVSARRISDYEYGERDVSVSELQLLAPHLGVTIEHFVGST